MARSAQLDANRRYRARQRRAGLRLLQIWVPDTRSPAFRKECRRQSLLLRRDAAERDATDFIAAVADWDEDAPR